MQHSLSSNGLTLMVGNFNLNLMQLIGFKEVEKNRAGNLASSFVWSKKNEHDIDRYIS